MKDFKKNYLIFLVIAGLFVAVIGLFSYGKFHESHARGDLAKQSHQLLKDVSRFKGLVFQGLSEQKRFLITRNPEYMDQYGQSKDAATELMSNILSITASDSERNAKALQIQSTFLSLNDSLQSETYKDIKDTSGILRLQRQLIVDIDEFVDTEDNIFKSRLDNLIALNSNFYVAVVVGSFAAFAVLMYMNYYMLLAQNREAETMRKFEELKEKQAQSVQATKDGIFEWKLQEQGIYWSPRLKEMIGYEDEELKASPETLEQLMHPEDREGFWQHLHKHLRGEIPEHSAFFRWRHKDGYWVWIHSRGRAIFNEFGDPVKLIGVHTDVTKLKEYELQLARSVEEAEKANSAKSDFLAHMSHEIRTPLTAITGVSEILTMQKDKFDDKTQKLLSALNASSVSLRDLISDILDFSKIESGKVVLEEKEIDLVQFFDDLISVVSVKALEKNLKFETDYQGLSGIKILGDKTRLRQILVNLIGNAVKFTNEGSIKVRAVPIVSNQKELLQVEVIDTGIGIEEEQLPFIFDSFRQADASISRKYGGTGLGLPIARHLAQLMGGNIYASSRVGMGSTFTVYLPMIKLTNVALRSKPAQKVEDEPQNLFLRDDEKVLIVEDYEGNIAFITHILGEMGVKYDLGRTGLEGVKLWSDNKYRLILMDIQMPEMDGISAVRHIRNAEKEEARGHVPIIAMTAHAFSEDKDKCLNAGFDDYLAKPLSKHSLFEKMSTLLNNNKHAA